MKAVFLLENGDKILPTDFVWNEEYFEWEEVKLWVVNNELFRDDLFPPIIRIHTY